MFQFIIAVGLIDVQQEISKMMEGDPSAREQDDNVFKESFVPKDL
jgi:hypothetical protein